MSGSDGANKRPRLPDAVFSPRLKRSSYAACINAGWNSDPSAMIVTPEAPVNAVNSAHDTSVTIASPPGNQPSSAWESLTRRCGASPALSTKPA